MTRPTFADALRQARQHAGLSQAAAADAIGISINTLQRIEGAKSDCGRTIAAALVRFYGLPPETMLL